MHDAALLAERIVKELSARGKTIAAAESCTGGRAADLIVSISGASKVFWGSFVCYTEDAKVKMLGIPEELIRESGAVSRETALAMARGALEKSGASWAFSVTGFAEPPGAIWIAVAGREGEAADMQQAEARSFLFEGSRNEVREAAAAAALEMIFERINRPVFPKPQGGEDIDRGED